MNEWDKSIKAYNPNNFSSHKMDDGKFELAGFPLNIHLGLSTIRFNKLKSLAQGSSLYLELKDANYDYIFHVDGESYKAEGEHIIEINYDSKIKVLRYLGQ